MIDHPLVFPIFAIVFFGIFFSSAFAIIFFIGKRRMATKEKLPEIASALKLSFNYGWEVTEKSGFLYRSFVIIISLLHDPWSITGEYNGVKVVIEPIYYGGIKNRTLYTKVRAYLSRPLEHGLKLYNENCLSKFGLKGRDIKLGDESLDSKYIIKGNNEEKIKEFFFSADVRGSLEKIHENVTSWGSLEIAYGYIDYEERGLLGELDTYRKLLDDATALSMNIKKIQ